MPSRLLRVAVAAALLVPVQVAMSTSAYATHTWSPICAVEDHFTGVAVGVVEEPSPGYDFRPVYRSTDLSGPTTLTVEVGNFSNTELAVFGEVDGTCVELCHITFGVSGECTVDAEGLVGIWMDVYPYTPSNEVPSNVPYVILATPSEAPSVEPPAECSDGLDNDADGAVDHPSDTGCDSADDPSEASEPPEPPEGCTAVASVPICADVNEGSVVHTVSVYEVGTTPVTDVTVVATVDLYEIPTPGGGSVFVDCLVLAAEDTSVNPCALAGGTFVSRTLTLVNRTETVPAPGLGDETGVVSICSATYTVTVDGRGPANQPGFALC